MNNIKHVYLLTTFVFLSMLFSTVCAFSDSIQDINMLNINSGFDQDERNNELQAASKGYALLLEHTESKDPDLLAYNHTIIERIASEICDNLSHIFAVTTHIHNYNEFANNIASIVYLLTSRGFSATETLGYICELLLDNKSDLILESFAPKPTTPELFLSDVISQLKDEQGKAYDFFRKFRETHTISNGITGVTAFLIARGYETADKTKYFVISKAMSGSKPGDIIKIYFGGDNPLSIHLEMTGKKTFNIVLAGKKEGIDCGNLNIDSEMHSKDIAYVTRQVLINAFDVDPEEMPLGMSAMEYDLRKRTTEISL